MASAASASAAASRAHRTTLAPSWLRARALARPSPFDDAVTSATFPFGPRSIDDSFVGGDGRLGVIQPRRRGPGQLPLRTRRGRSVPPSSAPGLGQGGQLLEVVRGQLDPDGGQDGLELGGVTAPDRTTSARGLASTAASATASTPTPWPAATRSRTAAAGPWPCGVSRPLATASPADHAPAGRARLGQGEAGRRSSRFQVACTQANGATPPVVASRARPDGGHPGGPAGRGPITSPSSRSQASSSSTARSESAAVEGGRVDLVQVGGRRAAPGSRGPGGPGRPASGPWPRGPRRPSASRRRRCSLGADGDLGPRVGPCWRPGGEERLGQAVGAGRVQVADPGGEGRVQGLVAAALQRLDPAVVAEVGVAAEVDEQAGRGGQAEPDRGDLEPGRAQGAGHRRRFRRWPATSPPT